MKKPKLLNYEQFCSPLSLQKWVTCIEGAIERAPWTKNKPQISLKSQDSKVWTLIESDSTSTRGFCLSQKTKMCFKPSTIVLASKTLIDQLVDIGMYPPLIGVHSNHE